MDNAPVVYTDQQKALIMKTVAPGLDADQFLLFLEIAKKTGLDPLRKQVFAVKYGDQMVVQTSIDGYLLMASRTGKYAGTCDPSLFVRTKDGQKVRVPHSEYDPEEHTIISGTIGVRRTDRPDPEYATALFSSYAVKDRNGKPNKFWDQMGDVMILKCALAKALRQAFPDAFSGIYTQEEMQQAQADATVVVSAIQESPALPESPQKTKDKSAKLKDSTEVWVAVVEYYLETLGYSSEAMMRAKAIVCEHFGVDEPEQTRDHQALAAFCRNELKTLLSKEGFKPEKKR